MQENTASNPENTLIDRYVKWLESLTAQATHRVSQFVAPSVRCRNPEAEGLGPSATAALFGQMFTDMDKVVTRVTDRAWGQDGFTVYLRWDRLAFDLKGGKHTQSGISEIMLGVEGKIVSIIEHWDSAPYKPPHRSKIARLFQR